MKGRSPGNQPSEIPKSILRIRVFCCRIGIRILGVSMVDLSSPELNRVAGMLADPLLTTWKHRRRLGGKGFLGWDEWMGEKTGTRRKGVFWRCRDRSEAGALLVGEQRRRCGNCLGCSLSSSGASGE
ncbi:unnamed protein product [Linum trigynum]|uniref:Uncharacterized protein n=1 Tax=Linum trigynum TaxID=586398 RepID=A0AAV2GCN3_9ROSI